MKLRTLGLLGACLASTPALASEDGTQHFPVGVNTISAGNLPPPGMLQYLDYFQVSPNPEQHDGDGHDINNQFHLTAVADAARFLYTWKNIQVGGLHYTTGLVVPFVNLTLDVAGHHGHDFGIGDVNIQNYLGGHTADKSLFYFFGMDTWIPVGNYDKNRLINTGNHYFTFGPNVDVTWHPAPRWELTGSIMAEFNTTNSATHYHSGSDIDLDYGMSYRPLHNRNFGIGVNGFFYKQYQADTTDGVRVSDDGDKGRVFAFGPQVRYDVPFGGFVVKYQHEFAVQNRPAGEQIWFQFAVPLTGKPKAE